MTHRYRGVSSSERWNALGKSSKEKCSLMDLMPYLALNSSMSLTSLIEPMKEPAIVISLSTKYWLSMGYAKLVFGAPTIMYTPPLFKSLWCSLQIQASQMNRVETTMSYFPAFWRSCSGSVECWTSEAPNYLRDWAFYTLVVKAVTSIPSLLAYWMERWPRPPIPITAHFPFIILNRFNGAQTVTPAQSKGGASFRSNPSGSLMAQLWSIWTCVQYPPNQNPQVRILFSQSWVCSSLQYLQDRSEKRVGLTPTLSPTLRSVTAEPISVISPTISCPGQQGQCWSPKFQKEVTPIAAEMHDVRPAD